MPGVFRSSINLARWRGAVPNALNAGRVDALLGASAITDVQAGLAREATLTGVGGVVNTINTNVNGITANGAQQATLTTTYNVCVAIQNSTAQQSTLLSIYNQRIEHIYHNDIALNAGSPSGASIPPFTVDPNRALLLNLGSRGGPIQVKFEFDGTKWIVRGYRDSTSANDNVTYTIVQFVAI